MVEKKNMCAVFWRGNFMEGGNMEDLGVVCITLAQDMVKCWSLVNTLNNFRVPLNAGNFSTI